MCTSTNKKGNKKERRQNVKTPLPPPPPPPLPPRPPPRPPRGKEFVCGRKNIKQSKMMFSKDAPLILLKYNVQLSSDLQRHQSAKMEKCTMTRDQFVITHCTLRVNKRN